MRMTSCSFHSEIRETGFASFQRELAMKRRKSAEKNQDEDGDRTGSRSKVMGP